MRGQHVVFARVLEGGEIFPGRDLGDRNQLQALGFAARGVQEQVVEVARSLGPFQRAARYRRLVTNLKETLSVDATTVSQAGPVIAACSARSRCCVIRTPARAGPEKKPPSNCWRDVSKDDYASPHSSNQEPFYGLTKLLVGSFSVGARREVKLEIVGVSCSS